MIEEDSENKPNIIIDNGSGYIKAGFSGEEWLRSVFPSRIGYPKYSSGIKEGNQKEFYVGADAERKQGVLKLSSPIEHGIVNNWDDMEKIWEYTFQNELKVNPEEYNVMLTEASLNPKENKEKMAQIMFETFKVSGLYISTPGCLSLYSAGKYTGMVVDLGDGVSHFCPIFEGYSLPHAVERLDLGGRDLTEYLVELLSKAGQKFTTSWEKETVKAIKEKACEVALDFEDEIRNVEPYDYELLDGCHIIIEVQRIRCPEALFKPNLIGKEYPGIEKVCYDSIQKCDIDIKRYLYNCIVLSGGTSMFQGLPERFEKEIKALVPDSIKEEVKIIASPERKYAIWIGASILLSSSAFESN